MLTEDSSSLNGLSKDEILHNFTPSCTMHNLFLKPDSFFKCAMKLCREVKYYNNQINQVQFFNQIISNYSGWRSLFFSRSSVFDWERKGGKKRMINQGNFLYLLLFSTILFRSHLYRYIRPYLPIVFIAFLGYRYYEITYLSKDLSPCCQPSDLLTLIIQSFEHLINFSFPPPTEHSDGEDHHSDHEEERVSIGLYMLKDILGLILIKEYFLWCYFFTKWNNLTTIIQHFINTIFQQVKDFSIVQSFLQKEEIKLEENIEKDLKKKLRDLGYHHTVLPEKGLPHDEILQLIQSSIQHENTVWENGKLSGSVYGGEKSHINFLNQCFSYYSMANVLHPDIWPSVMKYESEIVAMTASLVNGGKKSVCGSTTSVSPPSLCLFPSFSLINDSSDE